MDNNSLINNMISNGALKTPKIIEAFKKIDRKDFAPEELAEEAYGDYPLPIGHGQTISQPSTVAFMLELLQPKAGDKILDIGSGSGWVSALMAEVAGCDGKIFSVEIIPELKEMGEKNISKYNFVKSGRVKVLCMEASRGLPSQAPFDRIIAAAYADKIPSELKEQLKIGGRLVIPILSSIFVVERVNKDEFKESEYEGFAFVKMQKSK